MASLNKDSEIFQRLYTVIESRKGSNPDASYSAALLCAGMEKVAQKFGEEAIETVIAITKGEPKEIIHESADLIFHLLVAWAANNIQPEEVWAELSAREGTSGITEKALRNS